MAAAETIEVEQGSPAVLVVDDTPANLLAMSAVLKPLGVLVVEAATPHEALAWVEKQSFAVVLLDVQMPEMDGFEVATRMRNMPRGREVPIIFLTAIHRDELYARRGYKTGAADYITKPFDADILRARVRAFVDLYKQRESVRVEQVSLRTRERDEATRKLMAFERIATAALDTPDVSSFLTQLIEIFLGAADDADAAKILLREGDELVAKAARASNGESGNVSLRLPLGDGFAGEVATKKTSLELANAADSPMLRSEWLKSRRARVVFGVPLLFDGDVIGVALIASSRAEQFSSSDKRLLMAMVERASWAVSKHLQWTRLYEVLNASPALIAVVSGTDLKCEFINDNYRAMFGPRDIVGLPVREIGFNDEAREVVERVARTGETLHVTEMPITTDWRGDGKRELRYFNVTAQLMKGGMPAPGPRVLTFAVDVTPQVLARKQIEEHQAERARLLERERAARADAEVANRAKDEFLATVSHELRTPLNAIVGWTAAAKAKAPPEMMRALNIVERNARAQARIIEDVLDISRIISGKLRLDIKSVAADEPIRAAVEACRPAAEAKEVELHTEVPAVGNINVDPDRLQQVVWNLLSNAIKFTPKAGKVTLTVTRGDDLQIVVRDSGEGISRDFLPHIFEPFRQADASTTRRHGGLGLGLAIVRQIVQAHGGNISADSDGLGMGSVFSVSLPTPVMSASVEEPEVVEEAPALEPDTITLQHLRVLVVDDEEDARALLEHVFTTRGAVVELAASAPEALALLPNFKPDVLVSDIAMPEVDGYQFIRTVRSLPAERGGRTPAIALTAHARGEDTKRAFAAGFQKHLSKPVDVEHLVSTVANLGGLSLPDGLAN